MKKNSISDIVIIKCAAFHHYFR